MSITINYNRNLSKKNIYNNVLFVDEKFDLSDLKKHVSKTDFSLISDLIKTKDLKKKIIEFDISSKKKIILVSIKKNINSAEAENLGALFFDLFKNLKSNNFNIDSDTIPNKLKIKIGHFLHGLKLKSYSFEKYKSKK